MCLYSREHQTRLIKVGEAGDIGPVGGGHGDGNITGVLPKTAEPGIACLCIPDGYVMQLSGLSPVLINRLDLVSATAKAIFREGSGGNHDRDRFEFDNGSTQNLNNKLRGCQVSCLANSMDDYLATIPKQSDAKPGNFHAGVLSTVASRATVGVGVVSLYPLPF